MVQPSREVTETALARANELAQGLYPHQVEGVAFLLARRRSILADDMGLGKTRQSIIAMHEAEPSGPWLVVCPASVKRNWEREIRMVLDRPAELQADADGTEPGMRSESGKRTEVVVVDRKTPVPSHDYRGWVVINYDIIKKHAPKLGKVPFVGFVFDEAHYLKNHRAQRSKAARSLLDDSIADGMGPMVHCLTGTPMVNRPRDLFPLLQLVNHALGKSFLGFAKRYCDAQKGEYGWDTKGASNLDELTVQLHGTMLRRTKDEVLDLPGKIRTWLSVEMPETTGRRGMRRVLATLFKEAGDAESGPNDELPPISRSKLLARLTPVRSEIAGAKIKRTVEFAKGILDQGEKVIIYTCFQEVADTIVEAFEASEVRLLTGGTPVDDRQQAVDDFQNDDGVRVFCATVIAGGVGINLTAARTVIFNDLDWVPANHWQAEDRAYRIGQKHAVNVYYFKATNSIDEFVGQVLETKSAMINAVVEGQALGPSLADGSGGGDVLAELERVVREVGVQTTSKMTNKQLEAAFDEALGSYVPTATDTAAPVADPLHKPQRAQIDTIRALARALSPAVSTVKYRVASSAAGQFYEVHVDGSDVICTCRGFEFRGQCKHARGVKEALASGEPVPDEFRRI